MSGFDWRRHAPQNGDRWSPDVGDEIIGKITALSETESKFGGLDPTLMIETQDGSTVTWYARPASARAGLADVNAQVGDTIRVRRLADVQTPNGTAHRYEVAKAKPAEEEFAW